MKSKSTISNGARALAVVAVLFFTGVGIVQAGRIIGPLPPIIVGYESVTVRPGPVIPGPTREASGNLIITSVSATPAVKKVPTSEVKK